MVDNIQAAVEAMCLLSCFRTIRELGAGLAPNITPVDLPNSATTNVTFLSVVVTAVATARIVAGCFDSHVCEAGI